MYNRQRDQQSREHSNDRGSLQWVEKQCQVQGVPRELVKLLALFVETANGH